MNWKKTKGPIFCVLYYVSHLNGIYVIRNVSLRPPPKKTHHQHKAWMWPWDAHSWRFQCWVRGESVVQPCAMTKQNSSHQAIQNMQIPALHPDPGSDYSDGSNHPDTSPTRSENFSKSKDLPSFLSSRCVLILSLSWRSLAPINPSWGQREQRGYCFQYPHKTEDYYFFLIY